MQKVKSQYAIKGLAKGTKEADDDGGAAATDIKEVGIAGARAAEYFLGSELEVVLVPRRITSFQFNSRTPFLLLFKLFSIQMYQPNAMLPNRCKLRGEELREVGRGAENRGCWRSCFVLARRLNWRRDPLLLSSP